MADQIAASAQRALGMLIVKSKSLGGLSFQCYTKLYQSLVQSILDYGVSVWGHCEYASVNGVQLRAIRSFLGVHCKASKFAVLGEMGWTPQFVQQKVGIARQVRRLSRMDENRLNRKVYQWSFGKRCKNAAQSHKMIFDSVDLPRMYDLSSPISKRDVLVFKEKLMDVFVNEWYLELNRDAAKRGPGKNKLRTYRSFKHMYVTEEYLLNSVVNVPDRRAMAKFRCSATPLLIETGRYQKGTYKPEHERICRLCTTGVEDEKHVMLTCPAYEDVRQELFERANLYNPTFNMYCDDEKFVYIMSSGDIARYCAKTCKLILQRHRSLLNL